MKPLKKRSKRILIRAGLCLVLLAGLIIFRRESLNQEELKWIAFAAMLIFFVTLFNFFAARNTQTSEDDVAKDKP